MKRAAHVKTKARLAPAITIAAAAALLALAPAAQAATNDLVNPAFNRPCLSQEGVHCIGLLGQGHTPSDAKFWDIYNTTNGATQTELEPSTLVPGGKMLHVNTTTGGNGIAQLTSVSGAAYFCVWLKANSGAVSIAAGNGIGAPPAAILLNQGTWEVLNLGASANPVTAVTIYSYGGAADFDVESASLSLSHGQCVPH
jgi:hypothetical protein